MCKPFGYLCPDAPPREEEGGNSHLSLIAVHAESRQSAAVFPRLNSFESTKGRGGVISWGEAGEKEVSSKREEEDRVMMPEEKRRNSPSSFFPRPSVCQNRCLSNCSERRRRGGKKTEEESRPEEMANYPSTSSSPLSMHAHPCVCSCLHFHIFFLSRVFRNIFSYISARPKRRQEGN